MTGRPSGLVLPEREHRLPRSAAGRCCWKGPCVRVHVFARALEVLVLVARCEVAGRPRTCGGGGNAKPAQSADGSQTATACASEVGG